MAAGSGAMNDKNRMNDEQDPAEIRAEIDATRAELTQTLNAIQDRLNPQRLKQQATDQVRAATVGRVEDMADEAKWKVKGVGEDVFETIKRNPAPALLTAVGLGWLFMESRNRQSRREMRYEPRDRYYYAGETYGRGGYEYGYDEYGRRDHMDGQFDDRRGRLQQAGHNVRERAGEVVDTATGKVQGAASRVQDAAGAATSKVQDVAGAAGSKVQDVASAAGSAVQSAATNVADTAGSAMESARYGAHQMAQEAQYRAERVGSRFGEMMEENPLIIGAAAVALGAVIGFAFPASEKENQIFGEKRDELMERAQEVVGEKVQQVQQVAQEVAEATKETVKETAKNAAERQNLGMKS